MDADGAFHPGCACRGDDEGLENDAQPMPLELPIGKFSRRLESYMRPGEEFLQSHGRAASDFGQRRSRPDSRAVENRQAIAEVGEELRVRGHPGQEKGRRLVQLRAAVLAQQRREGPDGRPRSPEVVEDAWQDPQQLRAGGSAQPSG